MLQYDKRSPEQGTEPIFRKQLWKLAMKFIPTTVTMLLMYAWDGKIEKTIGSETMPNVVPATAATLAPFVTVNCTEDGRPGWAALGVEDATTT